MNSDYVVETDGLMKRFGDRVAVDNVEPRIPRGSAFGYLGPNGAGKIVAAAGEREAHGRIDGALDRVGLTARADERVSKYSLGMRQRLGVARALLAGPELLIRDEPTNGLDPASILEFRGVVRRLVGEGRTVVLSSHLLDEVERICDAVAIVDRRRVVWQDAIDAIHDGEQALLVAVDDPARALALLADHAVERTDDGLRVTLGTEAAAGINRRLVEAGVAVHRLEPSRASLEERLLQITFRLEEAAWDSYAQSS